jgi:hypothetical protein
MYFTTLLNAYCHLDAKGQRSDKTPVTLSPLIHEYDRLKENLEEIYPHNSD